MKATMERTTRLLDLLQAHAGWGLIDGGEVWVSSKITRPMSPELCGVSLRVSASIGCSSQMFPPTTRTTDATTSQPAGSG
jgi:hypothetical protein